MPPSRNRSDIGRILLSESRPFMIGAPERAAISASPLASIRIFPSTALRAPLFSTIRPRTRSPSMMTSAQIVCSNQFDALLGHHLERDGLEDLVVERDDLARERTAGRRSAGRRSASGCRGRSDRAYRIASSCRRSQCRRGNCRARSGARGCRSRPPPSAAASPATPPPRITTSASCDTGSVRASSVIETLPPF